MPTSMICGTAGGRAFGMLADVPPSVDSGVPPIGCWADMNGLEMWPFHKHDDAKDREAWDRQWVVARGEYQGRPMFVRKNVGAACLAGQSEF